MLAFVASSEADCSALNGVWVPTRLYTLFGGGVYAPPQESDTFAEWIQKLLLVYPRFEDVEVASYQETVCSSRVFPHCLYEAETWSCGRNPDFQAPWDTFVALVWVVASIMVAKELFKGLVLAWYRGFVPYSWRYVCGTSVLSPCVGLWSRASLLNLVFHEETPADTMRELFFEGVCEDFLSLPLGLYYVLSVTDVGLSDADLLSVLLTSVSVAIRLMDAMLWLFRGSSSKLTVSASVTRPARPVGPQVIVPVELETTCTETGAEELPLADLTEHDTIKTDLLSIGQVVITSETAEANLD
jgi:hypothetical protein